MEKHKVVYNAAVGGGLHLSDEAVAWLKERGMDVEAFPVVRGKVPGGYGPFWEIPRHAPLLVACVEALGEIKAGPRQPISGSSRSQGSTIISMPTTETEKKS